MSVRIVTAFCLLAIPSSVALAAPSAIEPTGMWSGKIRDASLRKLAPKSGFIADADAWKTLWTAWRADEKPATVDFAKELILVGTVPGPNLVIMRPTIDENGNVKFVVGGTKVGGPGFGYKLIKIAREGVKNVNGNAIDANGVQGVLVIPKTVGSFKNHTLEIKLWEYDPLLADASAMLADEFSEKDFGHTQGKETQTEISVGTMFEPRPDRRYYITVFILKDGNRTHIGEIGGKRGLGKVLADEKLSKVKVIARPVR